MDSADHAISFGEKLEYKIPGENWIHGVRHMPWITPQVMSRVADFPVHQDDVFVCGYPKTGTIWTTTIVSAILKQDNLDSWIQMSPVSLARSIDMGFQQAIKIPHPSYFNIHVPYYQLPRGIRENNAKIVHISRDPKDVAVSYYYFHKNMKALGPWNGPWDVFFDNFISGQVVFGNYFEIVRSYWEQKNNPNVMNIRYEQLKRDPKTWIGKLAEFLGKPLDAERLDKIVELTSFSSMKKTPQLNPDTALRAMEKKGLQVLTPGGSFLRKGVVGDWRHLFTEEQRRQTDGLFQQLCKDMGMDITKSNSSLRLSCL